MKNLKFGVFGLGLLVAIVTAVSSLSAQRRRLRLRSGQAGRAAHADRAPNVMVLDGRGSQLGVMVSDVDAKAAAGRREDR